MDDYVPHADNGTPRYIGVLLSKIWRKRACRLANDLHLMHHPGLHKFIAPEGVFSPNRISFDAIYCFQYVA